MKRIYAKAVKASSGPVARAIFKTKANSPKILFGVGIVGFVVTIGLAVQATRKAEPILEEHRLSMEDIVDLEEQYDGTDEGRHLVDVARVTAYSRTVGALAKAYSPVVLSGIISIAALSKAHDILNARNASLLAAITQYDSVLRKNMAREIQPCSYCEDREVSDEEKKKTRDDIAADDVYSVFFGEDHKAWSVIPNYNVFHLRGVQARCNDMLRRRGHIFLNEVYDELGYERTPAGAVVGWQYLAGSGDNEVRFGIFEGNEPDDAIHNFLCGEEPGVWLTFNVDGVIYDKI